MNETGIPIGIIVLMSAIGFIGVLAHWFKAATRRQAPWNLFKYLFMDKPTASGSMFAAYCASMWGLYSIGAFDLVKPEYVTEAWKNGVLFKPFAHAVFETITAGYICDSALNKSSPPGERRAAIQEMK